MANRICGLIARRSRALLSGATLAVLTVAPGNVFAQGLLPVSWQFGSVISGRSVAYSPDGSSIAVGGWSGVQLYTAATQQPIRGFPTAISSVSSVCFSPDGKTLLVAGSGSAIEIWNVSDARLKASLVTGAANVNSAAFSPDGKTVAVGGATANLGVVELWNVSSQTAVASLSTTSKEIDAVAFSSDGKVLAVGGTVDVAAEGSTIRQGVLELWDPSAGTLTASLAVAPAGIDAVAISPDGKTLACGGEADSIPGEVVEIWSLTTDSLVASCTTQVGLVSSLAFSPDGETVADCGYYGESSQHSINWVGGVELWSAGGGLISRTPANDLPQMFGIAYSPDGQTLAGVGTNSTSGYVFPPLSTFTYGFLNTWDANTLRLQTQTYLGSSAPTYSPPVFSPDGKTVLAGGLNVSTGALNRWSAVGGNWMGALGGDAGGNTSAWASSPDGKTIAIGFTPSGAVQLWDAATSKLIRTINTSAYWVSSIQFSPDSGKIAVGGATSAYDGVVEIWQTSTGDKLAALGTVANFGPMVVAFSPDGTILADCGTWDSNSHSVVQGVVELWNVSTGGQISSLATTCTSAQGIAFSPDGKTLAVGGQVSSSTVAHGVLELWTVRSGKLAATLPLATGTTTVASPVFTPNGNTLFAASDAGIQGFSTSNNGLLGTFANRCPSLSISPDGTLLAFGAGANGVVVCPVPGFVSAAIASLKLSPATVAGGAGVTGLVSLAQAAPPVGVSVGLTSNGPGASPPATVFIPGGSLSATFPVATFPVNSQTLVTITASSGPYMKSASLTLTSGALVSLSLSPNAVAGGGSSTGTVTLSGTARPGGAVVRLTSNSHSVAVPASVFVPAGKSTATFTVRTTPVAAVSSATVTASVGGLSQTASLTVSPPQLLSVTLKPATLVGGKTSTATVKISSPAPAGGLTIELSSDMSAAAVPNTVKIAAGQTSGTFTIKTARVTSQASALIAAYLTGALKTATLTITVR